MRVADSPARKSSLLITEVTVLACIAEKLSKKSLPMSADLRRTVGSQGCPSVAKGEVDALPEEALFKKPQHKSSSQSQNENPCV
jgi:hypothetical protein